MAHPEPLQKNMELKEAIECLSEGHVFWYVEKAQEICEALKLQLPESLIQHFKGQKDANPNDEPTGLWLNEDKPCSGVPSLPLSNWVVRQFKLKVPEFFGRGSQASANSEAVMKHFGNPQEPKLLKY